MHIIMPSRYAARRPVLVGTVAAGLAAVCYGTSQFLARKLVTEQDPPRMLAPFSLRPGMIFLATLSHRSLARDRHARKRAFLLMALSGISASAGVTLNMVALSMAPIVIVSPVSSITPLISLGLAYLFLRRLERLTIRTWIGATIVVAGVISITLGSM